MMERHSITPSNLTKMLECRKQLIILFEALWKKTFIPNTVPLLYNNGFPHYYIVNRTSTQDSLPFNRCNRQMGTDIKIAGCSCYNAKQDMAHGVSYYCFISLL